jgi:hypothetical protein
MLLLAAAAGAEEPAKITLIHGGEAIECRIEALPDAETLAVRIGDAQRLIKLADIQQIELPHVDGRPGGNFLVESDDGSRLLGRFTGGDASSLRIEVQPLGELSVPLDEIRVAINGDVADTPDGEAALAEARGARRDQDVLLLPVEGKMQSFPTLIRQLDDKGVRIQLREEVRDVAWSRIRAIVFASMKPAGAAAAPARAVLAGGSVVAGTITAFTAAELKMKTPFQPALAIPADQLARIEFTSDKVAFLSNMTPVTVEQAGYFGQSWPIRNDTSLTGGKLTLGGITHAKGIACHSHAAITYALEGKYKTFTATIGIDDATGDVGNCVFRVTDGAGKVLFDSGDVAAAEKPRPISVDVSGAAKIILVVDFGKDADVGDDAIWADARVIKP